MWHPWQFLHEQYPDWHVQVATLPAGTLGAVSIPDKIIWVRRGIKQVDRRWVVAHELVHMERDHDEPCSRKIECSVSSEAARRLISLEALGDAVRWTDVIAEIAAELWVPTIAVSIRIDHLHPTERAYLRRCQAQRGVTA